MQLREAKALGILDNHQARVRHVDADFDHRRRDEQRDLAILECLHCCLFLGRFHAPVYEGDAQAGKFRA